MKYTGKIKPLHSGLSAAPFIGVLFLMLPMLLFHTSIVFKPGVEVNLSLPVSNQKTEVADPSLSVAVDAENILYFRNRQVLGQVFSFTVEEEEEGMPLVDLVINRVEELDRNLVFRSVGQRRIQLNGKLAQPEVQLERGQQIELDVPSTELLRRRIEKAIEQEGFKPEDISLLIQADKAVRHDMIINLCNMAGEVGFGKVMLATRPNDFSRPLKLEK
ncbi:MAG: biopolymer transporter ExbD [Verrucomicrobiota bacterium]|nr:biopolymer transporter ExbD [Verrucomicrobiota bacterium]